MPPVPKRQGAKAAKAGKGGKAMSRSRPAASGNDAQAHPETAANTCACGGSCPRCAATAGAPLASSLRTAFERGLGQPLDTVRVHASNEAAQAAQAVGARAFSTADAIVLGGPMPAARRIGERFLLAHEVAHVAQMRGAGERPDDAAGHTPDLTARHSTDLAAEKEADRAAVQLAFGLGPARVTHRPAPDALLASPLSDSVDAIWLSAADKGRVFDALRAQGRPVADPDLDAVLARIFPAGSDDLWLAQAIARNGPEPLWPTADLDERRRRQRDHGWTEERGGIAASLLTTSGGRSVDAFFFPGTSDERALVIAGVHGSEQGGIEVAQMLIQTLQNALLRPCYTVIVVPVLFPDNAATRTRERATPTNRNFPSPGQGLDAATPAGRATPMDAGSPARAVLPENIALMRLIERFRPSRIASVHGSSTRDAAGIFSDAHTVSAGALARAADPTAATALQAAASARTASDQALALAMAGDMARRGFGRGVQGNHLGGTPTTGWSGAIPGGTSLGGWGPQDITEGRATDRPSMSVITVEVATNTRSTDLRGAAATARSAELASYRDVIREIFLGRP
ncbi:DUF4157 domain-containing protein [Variovorax sp. RCC_210]|uniref:eCIS core domain-containing protein n=1 Tax=Variovorax sp. RCC_210 TaxID=3239217 RepID=UPI0035268EB6